MPLIDRNSDAFLAIDVQQDFCAGGALAVPGGDAVVAPINRLTAMFAHVVATQDWHPADHASFAASHAGAAPFSSFEAPYGPQTLWPTHCVQGTQGAAFHRDFAEDRATAIIRKGWRKDVDSYSAFFENDRTTATGLGGLLRERGVARVFLAGLATDFCVSFSALDARNLGFEAFVVLDACRAIDLDGSYAAALAAWKEAGVAVVTAADLVGSS
jgi:nicotinamidase/pyrazinamidase